MITRIRKHEKSCEGDLSGIQPDINNDNGIPLHYETMGHYFLFQDTRILAREKNGFKRKIIEGIHIYNKKIRVSILLQDRKLTTVGIPS